MWITIIQMFFIGILECFGLSLNTKFLQRNKKIPSFFTSFLNILLWFIVISIAVEQLHNWTLRISYAFGFALGDILAIYFDGYLDKIAKNYNKFIKRKKRKIIRKKQ